jgi:LacI family transcriptional regulator, galactose operon repressor
MTRAGTTRKGAPVAAATLRDVAGAAGVHPATISRALDPGKKWLAKPETRARIQTALPASSASEPDVVARSLGRGRTTTVGVVVPDLGNLYVPPVLRGIANTLDTGARVGDRPLLEELAAQGRPARSSSPSAHCRARTFRR